MSTPGMATPDTASGEQLAWGEALTAEFRKLLLLATVQLLTSNSFAIDLTELIAYLTNPNNKTIIDLMATLLAQIDKSLVKLLDEI
jgi:hypothetical protein